MQAAGLLIGAFYLLPHPRRRIRTPYIPQRRPHWADLTDYYHAAHTAARDAGALFASRWTTAHGMLCVCGQTKTVTDFEFSSPTVAGAWICRETIQQAKEMLYLLLIFYILTPCLHTFDCNLSFLIFIFSKFEYVEKNFRKFFFALQSRIFRWKARGIKF